MSKNIKEVLAEVRVCDDEKARRVLNVSKKTATITAEEIEKGVTLERLSEIGVPVFRYSTQITIHGKIPDFDPESRPLGYKCIFRNSNGSLGVKYVAIDADKKKLISRAERAKPKSRFYAKINSQGLELTCQTFKREDAIAAYNEFPKDRIIGSVCAFRGIYGEFYVIAAVGAVKEENLWPLIESLYGFKSIADIEAAEEIQKQERDALHVKYEKECAERKVEEDAKWKIHRNEAYAKLSKHSAIISIPPAPCRFIRIVRELDATAKVWIYAVGKGVYARIEYSEENLGWTLPERGRRALNDGLLARWNETAERGNCFSI